jgi:Flp pilus assembly protein TadG
MFWKFLRDARGNFALLTAIAMVPILGGLALGIDYVAMSRQRQDTLNALDAANMAAARRILDGASDAVVRAYARDFFDVNLRSVEPQNVDLEIFLPASLSGGGRVKMVANVRYDPIFLPPFQALLNRTPGHDPLTFSATSEVQLKNTVEVALVLDNSGSMDDLGKGSGKKRIDLLKTAATELVTKLATTAALMKQVQRPVQFSLVPFAASVNVGPENHNASWMDTTGISPIHHENFDWATLTASNKKIQQINGTTGPFKKVGTGWGSDEGKIVTRLTLLADLRRYFCSNGGTSCSSPTLKAYTDYDPWKGCVESRPAPYNTDDESPTSAAASLYVPMFAPDEAGDFRYNDSASDNLVTFSAYNTWWNDLASSSGTSATSARSRQRNMLKYYTPLPKDAAMPAADKGPNASCTTKPITPLTDVTTDVGLKKIKDAISAMGPGGATNVPEGLAWGWRTLSSQAPFTGGRPETERGNDKVVIALTDGANTYYTPSSLGAQDIAGNQSTYSAFGYAYLTSKSKTGRIFDGTSSSVSKGDFSNENYSKAMNEQFIKTCVNANGGDTGGIGANIIVMTVALDLDATKTADKAQLEMLKKCASRSRYSRDPDDLSKGRKLFWNATGSNLSQVFKEIADELSNLRFVG